MQPILPLVLFAAAIASPLFAQPATPPAAVPADPFETGMRDAFTAYKKGEMETVSGKLHELIAITNQKVSSKLALLLPDAVGGWKGEAPDGGTSDLPAGAAAASRSYNAADHRITAKIVKDAAMVENVAPSLTNEELLKVGNRNIHKFGPLTGVMDGEHKLELIIGQRFYVVIEGNEQTPEADLVAFTEKLNLAALEKLK